MKDNMYKWWQQKAYSILLKNEREKNTCIVYDNRVVANEFFIKKNYVQNNETYIDNSMFRHNFDAQYINTFSNEQYFKVLLYDMNTDTKKSSNLHILCEKNLCLSIHVQGNIDIFIYPIRENTIYLNLFIHQNAVVNLNIQESGTEFNVKIIQSILFDNDKQLHATVNSYVQGQSSVILYQYCNLLCNQNLKMNFFGFSTGTCRLKNNIRMHNGAYAMLNAKYIAIATLQEIDTCFDFVSNSSTGIQNVDVLKMNAKCINLIQPIVSFNDQNNTMKHSVKIRDFDKNIVLYLLQKGIGKRQIKNILIKSFFNDEHDEITASYLKRMLVSYLNN